MWSIVAAQDHAPCSSNMRNVVYGSSTRPQPLFKGYEEYGLWRKRSIHPSIMLHWKLCEKWRLNKVEKWYIHKPKKLLESEVCKILWDFPIQTDKNLKHNGPDITVIDKKSKKCLLIDRACPFGTRIERKEEEKYTNYSKLKHEMVKIWKMRKVIDGHYMMG